MFVYLMLMWIFVLKGAGTLAQPEQVKCVGASEFFAVDELARFSDALTRREQRDGQLAVPFSEAENNAAIELVRAIGGNKRFWLGKELLSLKWATSVGSSYSYLVLSLRDDDGNLDNSLQVSGFNLEDNFSTDIRFFEV